MARADATAPPEAIRIEDEVWQDAFTRREPARRDRDRPLRAIDGGRSPRAAVATPAPLPADPPIPPPDRAQDPPPPAALNGADSPARAELAPRRTVTIQGRGAERNLPWPDGSRRRPIRRAHERAGFRPDRLAMWAMLLGFLLILVAIASGHS